MLARALLAGALLAGALLALVLLAAPLLVTAWPLLLLSAVAASTEFLGREAHTPLTIGAGEVVIAIASPTMLKPVKLNTVSAPSAAGLRIRALTCATSLL